MRYAPILIVAAPLLLAACSEEAEAPAEIIRPVQSIVLQPQALGMAGYVGTIEPDTSAQLSFQLLGRVVSRDVDIGDIVKPGETLASLDPSALRLQVEAASADLASAQAQLANASASEERQRLLLESKSTPQAAYDAAKQALDSATANAQASEAALAKAQEQLGYARISSDFDGVVTAIGAEVGQVVNPGQMVVTVARSGARDAVIDMPDMSAARLKTGDRFNIVLQSAPSVATTADVREVAPQADNATRTRRVKLALDNAAPRAFRLGSTVNVTHEGASEDVLAIPQSAVLDENGKKSVWVVDAPSATVNLKPVELEPGLAGMAVVKSGVEAGARIVTAGIHSLKPGQKIKIDGGL